eukprot:8010973-Lingulodinium_polyedra.AAC.1
MVDVYVCLGGPGIEGVLATIGWSGLLVGRPRERALVLRPVQDGLRVGKPWFHCVGRGGQAETGPGIGHPRRVLGWLGDRSPRAGDGVLFVRPHGHCQPRRVE